MPGGTAPPPLLDAEGFAGLMARFAPFEPAPRLAVAVSGGADSLALLRLLDGWVRARGGSLLALTVDHGLRPEAAAEAAWVGRRCAERGIAHRVLTWTPPAARPAGGLQAAARAARYRLLAEACRAEGVLHLALAHQRDDQAETLLLRLAAGSGPDGLAAMPAVAYLDAVRLLRPLLGTPRPALEALLHAAGEDWLEDPSNRDAAYARTRLREAASRLAGAGLTPQACGEAAEAFGRLRRWSEPQVARLLVESCRLDPRGFARLDGRALRAAPRPVALRALAALLRCLAGRVQAPRGPRLERLLARLAGPGFAGATLAGCRILPRAGDRLLVVREPAAVDETAEPPAEADGAARLWDGRFRVLCRHGATEGRAPAWTAFGRLAPAQRRMLLDGGRGGPLGPIPPSARAGLPVSHDLDGHATLPHLTAKWSPKAEKGGSARFAPRRALTAGSFAVFR